jgi:hypothetical protein
MSFGFLNIGVGYNLYLKIKYQLGEWVNKGGWHVIILVRFNEPQLALSND